MFFLNKKYQKSEVVAWVKSTSIILKNDSLTQVYKLIP